MKILEKKKVGLLIFRCLFCDVDFKDQEGFNIHDTEEHFKDLSDEELDRQLQELKKKRNS